MKTLHIFIFLILLGPVAGAQVTTPTVRALFGVDADKKANFVGGTNANWNDDWFSDGTCCGGTFVIDTTGAAAWMSQYNSNPASWKQTFVRKMSLPQYSVQTSRLWYDALMVRDHQCNDTTAFTMSNKNGDNPLTWDANVMTLPVKNDIKDVMVHVRRDGSNLTDSLYFLAGLSLEGNDGNRYFDIELYQTEMVFNPATKKFENVGPDAGHTAWQLDATGKVTQAGDIIFSAEFGATSLSNLEARIWVHVSTLAIVPANFNWSGTFNGDGSGALYGYAGILPKAGGQFYSGMQNAAGAWAGPFGNVSDTMNTVSSTYNVGQFMEIAVNLTKIGLDPYSLTALTNACGIPFKRLFAKTRSSVSFTSELKDFIGPIAFGMPEAASATPNVSMFCGSGYQVSTLTVNNPLSTSTYNWTTDDGNFVTAPATGTSVYVDAPGTYVVAQSVYAGCAPHSRDTIVVGRIHACALLDQQDHPTAQQPEKITKVSINPNPATDHFAVSVPGTLKNASLTLYDASGKLINKTLLLNSITRIPMAGLPRGIYYVKVEAQDGYHYSQKILKQ